MSSLVDALGLGSSNITVKTADPINYDDTQAQADELLRKRLRRGVNANLSNGTAGDSTVSASSSGQKTLLGG